LSTSLKPGARVHSAVCETEVIVVRAPADEIVLQCGGAEMLPIDEPAAGGAALDAAFSGGTLLGKRYADEELGLELLCTKAGAGSLAVDGTPLEQKSAKPLPASD